MDHSTLGEPKQRACGKHSNTSHNMQEVLDIFLEAYCMDEPKNSCRARLIEVFLNIFTRKEFIFWS